ncbi:unnamed protein product [Adineta ricciae]|uniref:Uncharacterized protein n=1 Tax=Adineta ricciae TaxID=249248 RepID=A0A813PA30_ADIRI|nr:unnamed protein product [Adineta ricciae]CAF1086582.1 unnamed protein product [Adineta ricciae]
MKHNKVKFDELGYWDSEKSCSNNEGVYVNDQDQSIALSVSLLQKHKAISAINRIRVRSHTILSAQCQCHRSFHLFCTDLFNDSPTENDMINQHPAPHCHDRDVSRRVPTPFRKYRHRFVSETIHQEKNLPNESEKLSRMTSKIYPRISSSKVPSTEQSSHRSVQTPIKTCTMSKHSLSKSTASLPQLQIRSLPIHDPFSSEPQIILPRTPPPSPKTPTYEPSITSSQSDAPASLQIISLTPRNRLSNEHKKESPIMSSSAKIATYDEHAQEYLSAVDHSEEVVDKDNQQPLISPTIRQLSASTRSLSRSGTALSVRLLSHVANRYLNLQKNHDSLAEIDTNSPDRIRRTYKPQRRLRTFINDSHEDTTNKSKPLEVPPRLKSVFGFSKTASSMHFGYAADQLGLQGTFEKWPRPRSRRTSVERKHEVTTLRLVTLPLVTSR